MREYIDDLNICSVKSVKMSRSPRTIVNLQKEITLVKEKCVTLTVFLKAYSTSLSVYQCFSYGKWKTSIFCKIALLKQVVEMYPLLSGFIQLDKSNATGSQNITEVSAAADWTTNILRQDCKFILFVVFLFVPWEKKKENFCIVDKVGFLLPESRGWNPREFLGLNAIGKLYTISTMTLKEQDIRRQTVIQILLYTTCDRVIAYTS